MKGVLFPNLGLHKDWPNFIMIMTCSGHVNGWVHISNSSLTRWLGKLGQWELLSWAFEDLRTQPLVILQAHIITQPQCLLSVPDPATCNSFKVLC